MNQPIHTRYFINTPDEYGNSTVTYFFTSRLPVNVSTNNQPLSFEDAW